MNDVREVGYVERAEFNGRRVVVGRFYTGWQEVLADGAKLYVVVSPAQSLKDVSTDDLVRELKRRCTP